MVNLKQRGIHQSSYHTRKSETTVQKRQRYEKLHEKRRNRPYQTRVEMQTLNKTDLGTVNTPHAQQATENNVARGHIKRNRPTK